MKYIRLKELECDEDLVSPSDFTIMLKHIPPHKNNEEDIK